MDLRQLKQSLSDAGCLSETADDIIRMCEAGNMKSALLLMRKDRCRLMEEMHKYGRKVDCLDGSNSWSYTRLGHIEDRTKKELTQLLGEGNVSLSIRIDE